MAEPSDFTTKEQVRYAKDHVVQELSNGLDRMFKDVFKLGPSGRRTLNRGGMISMEITHKSSSQRPIRKPVEEQLRRDVICPSCGLDHSVYGLATWCADCGTDIFLTHIDAELAVIGKMLSDVPRRREILGERIVAKDLENCLEDTVSIFEAVLKILTRRAFIKQEMTAEEIDQIFRQNGNCFQSINRTIDFLTTKFQTRGCRGFRR